MQRYTEELPAAYAVPGHETLIEELASLSQYVVLSGRSSTVVREATLDGEDFIVRTFDHEARRDDEDIDFFHNRIAALYHGLGHQSLEQLVSYRLDPLLVVSKRAPGNPLSSLTERHVKQIKVEQFGEVIDALKSVQEKGIVLDTGNVDNALYHPKKGFTLIDYTKEDDYQTSTLEEFLAFMGMCLRSPAIKLASRSVGAKALKAINLHYSDVTHSYPDDLRKLSDLASGQS